MNQFAQFDAEPAHKSSAIRREAFTTRNARPDDIEELALIAAERAGEATTAWRVSFEKYFDETSDPSRKRLLVAETPGIILGYGKFSHFLPPSDCPSNVTPEGWYLAGVIVRPAYRRCGIAQALTAARLEQISLDANECYYFCNARNTVSVALHAPFGFVEQTRNFWHPQVQFEGGVGILFRRSTEGLAT